MATSWKKLRCRFIGEHDIIMNNGRLADPLDEFAKEMTAIRAIRTKTPEHHERMAELEFRGSLYLDDAGRPVWPGRNLKAALVDGGKKFRNGPIMKSGCRIEGHYPFVFDGPKDADKLWEQRDKFGLRTMVKGDKGKRIPSTRPIFTGWELEFMMTYNTNVVTLAKIKQAWNACGEQVGMGNWRPEHGLFTVECIDPVN